MSCNLSVCGGGEGDDDAGDVRDNLASHGSQTHRGSVGHVDVDVQASRDHGALEKDHSSRQYSQTASVDSYSDITADRLAQDLVVKSVGVSHASLEDQVGSSLQGPLAGEPHTLEASQHGHARINWPALPLEHSASVHDPVQHAARNFSINAGPSLYDLEDDLDEDNALSSTAPSPRGVDYSSSEDERDGGVELLVGTLERESGSQMASRLQENQDRMEHGHSSLPPSPSSTSGVPLASMSQAVAMEEVPSQILAPGVQVPGPANDESNSGLVEGQTNMSEHPWADADIWNSGLYPFVDAETLNNNALVHHGLLPIPQLFPSTHWDPPGQLPTNTTAFSASSFAPHIAFQAIGGTQVQAPPLQNDSDHHSSHLFAPETSTDLAMADEAESQPIWLQANPDPLALEAFGLEPFGPEAFGPSFDPDPDDDEDDDDDDDDDGENDYSPDLDFDAFVVEDFEQNFDFRQFIEQWSLGYLDSAGFKADDLIGAHLEYMRRPKQIKREDLKGEAFDVQGINWKQLRTKREIAREARANSYINYSNLGHSVPSRWAHDLPETDDYFQFRRMDTTKRVYLMHFQLRHLLSATSKNDVYYAGRGKVFCTNPSTYTQRVAMDVSKSKLTDPYGGGMRISTLTADHGVLIAGGFGGEYAMTSLDADYESKHTEGFVTKVNNGITNHVHTCLSRSSGSPTAVFSSNDCKIRVLDCYTNKLFKEHDYGWAVNCSATSPDGRMRVVVGDNVDSVVSDAEKGTRIETLRGHRDFGFACAWADDGIHLATGNQDAQVYIYDLRMLRRPLQVIASEMAGVRSLRFSPVGGGKRVLLMAESADIVSVVDAESFETKQRLDFFGEIGGISFTPDGSDFYVANTDRCFGGIMEYERIGYGEQHGMRWTRQREIEDAGDEYHEEKDFEWLPEEDLDLDKRVKLSETSRQRRGLDLGNLVY
ncbi:MAG: hypothetical protein M1819_001938 [Sarea resinae]|nr:MAG: hypothetical protein M1819_001938 [Sarea resinae]